MNVPLKAQAARSLERLRPKLVEETVENEFRIRPDFWRRWGEKGKVRCTEDTNFHINFLVVAMTMDTAAIFLDYVDWLVGLLKGYGMGEDDVRENFECLKRSISGTLPMNEAQAVCSLLDEGLGRLGKTS